MNSQRLSSLLATIMQKLSSKNRRSFDWTLLAGMTDTEKVAAYETHCAWPALYYDTVSNILRATGSKQVVEVGVAYGYHARNILNTLPSVSYFGIDPYVADYDANDGFSSDVAHIFADEPQKAMDRLHSVVSSAIAQAGGKVIRMPSTEACKTFSDGELDTVFIDGDHRYSAVLADLKAWFPKVREGGLCLGDDFRMPQVAAAWQDFADEAQVQLQVLSSSRTNYPIAMLVR